MKRGIFCNIPDNTSLFLRQLLAPIDFTHYRWQNERDEMYLDEAPSEPVFQEEPYILDGDTFERQLSRPHTVFLADFKAFPLTSDALAPIETYDDFLASDCVLIVLVVDSEYAVVYSKQQATIQALYDNAVHENFPNVAFLTDDNDSRTQMTTW